MKTILVSTIMGCLVLISSCKKEENSITNSSPIVSASLVGSWTWTEAYTPNNNGQYIVPLNPNGVPAGKQITYTDNGTYSANWSFAQMGFPSATNPDSGTYINTDSLVMTSTVTGLKVRAKIYKLTSNELWFRYNGNTNYEIRFTK